MSEHKKIHDDREHQKSAKNEEPRVVRDPVELRKRLRATHRDGYIRRFFNEDRLDYALQLGYTFVEQNELNNTVLTQDPSQMGQGLKYKRIYVGNGTYQVLMEIKEDLYKEYRTIHDKTVDDREATIKGLSKGRQ